MDFIYSVSDQHVDTVINALADHFGYNNNSEVSKDQFVRVSMINFIKQIVKEYKSTQALNEVRQQIDQQIDQIEIK